MKIIFAIVVVLSAVILLDIVSVISTSNNTPDYEKLKAECGSEDLIRYINNLEKERDEFREMVDVFVEPRFRDMDPEKLKAMLAENRQINNPID